MLLLSPLHTPAKQKNFLFLLLSSHLPTHLYQDTSPFIGLHQLSLSTVPCPFFFCHPSSQPSHFHTNSPSSVRQRDSESSLHLHFSSLLRCLFLELLFHFLSTVYTGLSAKGSYSLCCLVLFLSFKKKNKIKNLLLNRLQFQRKMHSYHSNCHHNITPDLPIIHRNMSPVPDSWCAEATDSFFPQVSMRFCSHATKNLRLET